jgi:HK97 family phage major capsid protein
MEELEKKLLDLQSDLTKLLDQATEQKTNIGNVEKTLLEKIEAVQAQADAIDMKMQAATARKGGQSIEEVMMDSGLKDMIGTKKRGRAVMEFKGANLNDFLSRKTVTASTLGGSTPGVVQYEMSPGIVEAARLTPRMRDVIPSRPTSLPRIAWLKETVRPTKASPVAEAGHKLEVGITVAADYEDVKKIAIIMKASDEILTDASELAGFMRAELANRVREEEDYQILFGDNSGQNLNGLTTQAQAWDLTKLTASDGYEYIDIVAGALQQIAEDNEISVNPFVVLHYGDWWKIKRTKDSTGRYILGDPSSPYNGSLWGATPVPTNAMTSGYFCVGSSSPLCAEIRDRLSLAIDISNEDDTNFQYNLVTIRAELRLALVVKRPDAFVYGAFTQSPA